MAQLGKITDGFFQKVILPRLGAQRPEVAVGPQQGVDVGILELGDYALAMTADPVFIVPEYGWERSAWFALHILASDAATSGLAIVDLPGGSSPAGAARAYARLDDQVDLLELEATEGVGRAVHLTPDGPVNLAHL